MSRITGIWKRRLRPVLLTAAGRWLGGGTPPPSTAIRVPALAASGRCELIRLGTVARQVLPPRELTGDLAAVAAVRSAIDDAGARDRYDRLLAGTVALTAAHPFVAILPDGHASHDSGVVTTAAGELVEDVSGLGFASDDPTNPLRLGCLPRPRHAPLTVAVLTTGPHHNYFHWMLEALPRLECYAQAGVAIDRFYAPVRLRFQRESLALLGIPRERIVTATRWTHLTADRLAAASLHGSLSRAKTDFLHRRFTERVDPGAGPARRLFIARAGRGPRSIVNERELLAALRPLGFQRCRLESMSLAEQVAVLHRAECVIGAHGAGLTNLLFCRAGTVVVEIGTPYRPWSCFYEIAHHRDLDYRLQMASPVRIRHFDRRTGVGDSDLRVDAGGLRGLVGSLLETRGLRRGRAA